MSILMNFGAGADSILQMMAAETEGNYLFLGKSGLHKKAFAREQIRKNLGAKNLEYCPDYFEVDCEKTIGIEMIAEIFPFTETMAILSKKKYCLIANAERLTVSAANALLKLIEESSNVIFVFTAKKPLIDTVMSRVRVCMCNPLTRRQFFEEYPDANELVSRFVCGRPGFYEKIMENKKLQDVVFRIVNGIDRLHDAREFLEIFSQVKEKDPNSFFELDTEFVDLGLEYVAEQVMLCMLGKKDLPYDAGRCWTLLGEISGARVSLDNGNFGKNDFFALVRKLAE